jgi:hypothetical protein
MQAQSDDINKMPRETREKLLNKPNRHYAAADEISFLFTRGAASSVTFRRDSLKCHANPTARHANALCYFAMRPILVRQHHNHAVPLQTVEIGPVPRSVIITAMSHELIVNHRLCAKRNCLATN